MSAQQQARGVLMGLLDTPHRPGHFDNRHRKGCQCCEGVTSEVGVFIPAAADRPLKGRFRQKVVISFGVFIPAAADCPLKGRFRQKVVISLRQSKSCTGTPGG